MSEAQLRSASLGGCGANYKPTISTVNMLHLDSLRRGVWADCTHNQVSDQIYAESRDEEFLEGRTYPVWFLVQEILVWLLHAARVHPTGYDHISMYIH